MLCPRRPASPAAALGTVAAGRKDTGDHFRETPGAQSLPPAQEAWRGRKTGPVAFQKSLFPSGSPKSHLPSWASSAGINTTKGMFSLPLGFTMCWGRKNKSFIPTRAIGWRQNFPGEARKFPPAFQRRRWARGRWAGAGGMKCRVWGLGGGREGDSGVP